MWNAFKRWLDARRQSVVYEEIDTTQEIEVNGFSFLMMSADFEDVDDLAALEQIVYGEPLAWTADVFRDDLQNNLDRQYMILRQPETNSLVGYLGIALSTQDNQVHVTSITIAPHWQGRAVGTFLMTYMMMWAQQEGFEQIYLEVRAADEDAQRFYRRLGFEKVNELPDYYGENDDAHQMVYVSNQYQGDYV
ncbi:GNAT family N-acetyltransferase [Weissella tructae]|uniref:Ribosomal-protein-alanine N-acetyltransferase n=2 Tax=Weissella TaxID=46255 RepID=A0A075U0H4_9LACO|nr:MULTISPECIES: N-acetyltransferase [Weissella]AIG66040.1 Ribosomal-protein-alanine N-acetyltransferase [Weissella tructae]AIM63419.1 Ribosomal-protein-alanine N-acetyltransferase [Weissella ceti]AIM64754.1 Ribosomal-protein-alanine N-acetyltransferase [Weissella ceti]ELA07411.1 ribosomal-protein-alanine N-acetyltransferase [Weissella ceti NC36]QVV91193.1 GNAT family N-acetyltransferase [Weissella tructae]